MFLSTFQMHRIFIFYIHYSDQCIQFKNSNITTRFKTRTMKKAVISSQILAPYGKPRLTLFNSVYSVFDIYFYDMLISISGYSPTFRYYILNSQIGIWNLVLLSHPRHTYFPFIYLPK